MHLQKLWLLPLLVILGTSQQAWGTEIPAGMGHKRQADEPESTIRSASPDRTTARESNGGETTAAPERTTNPPRGSATTSRRATGTFVDPRSPPGGVVMQTPVTTSGSQYYKIGNPITFGWNYTSLLIRPTAVNVEAVCSDNSQTYTIAANVSAAEPSVVWDTGSYQPNNDQPPLAMGIYTLNIYDEQSEMTAAPSPGRLAPFNGFKFGMYTPKPYTPLADFECATCEKNAAGSLDAVALRILIITTSIISVSFALFVGSVA